MFGVTLGAWRTRGKLSENLGVCSLEFGGSRGVLFFLLSVPFIRRCVCCSYLSYVFRNLWPHDEKKLPGDRPFSGFAPNAGIRVGARKLSASSCVQGGLCSRGGEAERDRTRGCHGHCHRGSPQTPGEVHGTGNRRADPRFLSACPPPANNPTRSRVYKFVALVCFLSLSLYGEGLDVFGL